MENKHERENQSNLSIAMVEDKIDIQSSYVAQEFFKEEVEKVMKDNGDHKEAYFCELIRNWYNALDKRGISAIQRIKYLLKMRTWILGFLRPLLCTFPPPGSHIATIPVRNFDGMLISTERVIQMHSARTFNVRSLGSQICE